MPSDLESGGAGFATGLASGLQSGMEQGANRAFRNAQLKALKDIRQEQVDATYVDPESANALAHAINPAVPLDYFKKRIEKQSFSAFLTGGARLGAAEIAGDSKDYATDHPRPQANGGAPKDSLLNAQEATKVGRVPIAVGIHNLISAIFQAKSQGQNASTFTQLMQQKFAANPYMSAFLQRQKGLDLPVMLHNAVETGAAELPVLQYGSQRFVTPEAMAELRLRYPQWSDTPEIAAQKLGTLTQSTIMPSLEGIKYRLMTSGAKYKGSQAYNQFFQPTIDELDRQKGEFMNAPVPQGGMVRITGYDPTGAPTSPATQNTGAGTVSSFLHPSPAPAVAPPGPDLMSEAQARLNHPNLAVRNAAKQFLDKQNLSQQQNPQNNLGAGVQ